MQIIFVLLPSKNSKTYRAIKPPFFEALVDVTGTHMAYTTTVHAQLVYFLTFVTRLRSQFEYRSFSYGRIFTALRNDVYIRYNQNFNTLKFFSSCATFHDNTFTFKQQTRINAILLLNITSRLFESIVLRNDRYAQIQKFTLYDTKYFRIYTFEKQKAGRYDGFFFPLSRYVMNNARDAKIARNASCASLTATAESKRIESVTVSRVEQARERERKKERNAYDWREQR